jgi:hypothetical protein
MKPDPGSYGPVPWSAERPPLLWAGAILLLVVDVYSLSLQPDLWSFGETLVWLVPLYLALRGSRLAWLILLVLGILFGIFEIVASFGSLAASRWEGYALITGVLMLASSFLWLTPSVRRFFDLKQRASV